MFCKISSGVFGILEVVFYLLDATMEPFTYGKFQVVNVKLIQAVQQNASAVYCYLMVGFRIF